MRTTVGPLSAAVYWRRRAVVLGVVLLSVIVMFVACGRNGDDDKRPTSSPASQPASASAAPDTSFADPSAGGEPVRPDPGAVGTPSAAASSAPALPQLGQTVPPTVAPTLPADRPAADPTCADNEIALVPVPAAKAIKRTATLDIGLRIKNTSTRVCSRDVGAEPQELYLDRGPQKFWSSDTCSTDKSTNVRKLQPGEELTYKVTWNGKQSSKCTGGAPAGPNPPAGEFDLRGRLGTLVSDPVTITIAE